MIELKPALLRCQGWQNNSMQLRSVLRDLYPNNKREINVISTVLESGIADRIQREAQINEIIIEKYLVLLDEDYGIQRDAAAEAIESWSRAFGIIFERKTSIRRN